MSAAHTPGPWAVNFTKFKEVRANNGALVATCNKLNGLVNLQANARLIAAAPDLLRELAALHLAYIATLTNQATGLIDDPDNVLTVEADQDLLNGIDAAIAKAKGTS